MDCPIYLTPGWPSQAEEIGGSGDKSLSLGLLASDPTQFRAQVTKVRKQKGVEKNTRPLEERTGE